MARMAKRAIVRPGARVGGYRDARDVTQEFANRDGEPWVLWFAVGKYWSERRRSFTGALPSNAELVHPCARRS